MSSWQARALPLDRPGLPPRGTLDLWLADLTDMPLEAGPSGLTRRERVFKQRIQQQFTLRLLLGAYLGRPGKDVRVSRDANGKPVLAGGAADRSLTFNLSHSGHWLAIVVARELPVGVDIETDRRLRRPLAMARRYFPSADAATLDGLDEPGLSRAFLDQWTRREALVKATGAGLSGHLGSIELRDGAPVGLPPGWTPPAEWSLLEPQWPAGLIGCVAAPRPGLTLRAHFLQTGRGH